MKEYAYITLRQKPELKETAANCLPWMNTQGFKSINCWSECLPLLVSSGAIVIIPTTTHDCVKDILRDYKSIKLKDIHKYPDVY